MVQCIVIIVVLVCLSDSSLSRSWVGFDEDVDYESRLADPDGEPNWKSRYQGGGNSWENDESDEDYEDTGYRYYQPTGYHDSHTFGYPNQNQHHGHEQHGCNGNCEHNHHQEHGRNHDNNYGTPSVHGYPSHNKEPANWHPSHRGQEESTRHFNHENEHHRYPGQHSEYPRTQGYPVQSGYPDRNPGSHGHTSDTGPNGHHSQTGSVKPAVNSESPRDFPQNNQQGSENDGDRVVFPDFNNLATTTTRAPPTSTARPAVTTAPTTPTLTTTTDRSLLDLVICVRACPATAEYNPVCGSNNVTYNNPGALQCARNCGLNVTIARRTSCPRPIPRLSSTVSDPITGKPVQTTPFATTSTATPVTAKPTRFTNIDANTNKPPSTLIPLDLLQSVFGSATPTNSRLMGVIDKQTQP